MSMSFEEFAQFFGKDAHKDGKVTVYLSVLWDGYQKTKKLELTDQEELKGSTFIPPTSDPIHLEWKEFAVGLNALSGNSLSNEALKVVRKLAGVQSGRNVFFQEVVKAHSDVSPDASTWGSTSSAVYKAAAHLTPFASITGNATYTPIIPSIPTEGAKFSRPFGSTYLKLKMEEATTIPSYPASEFWNTQQYEVDVVFRKHDNPKKLWRVVGDKTIDVSAGTADVSGKADCAVVGLNGNEGECGRYLLSCLNGTSGSIDACKSFMLRPDFWEVSREEVKNMLPRVAVDTLSKFGFQQVVNSSTKLNEVENVPSWSARLKDVIKDPTELNQILTNTKLMGYLGLLVQKVNGSPAILNEGVVGNPKGDNMVDLANAFKGTYAHAAGVKPYNDGGANLAQVVLRQSQLALMNLTYTRNLIDNRFVVLNGAVLVPGMHLMRGGAVLSIPSVSSQGPTPLKENYPIMKNLVELANKKLADLGRPLNPADANVLASSLEELRKAEDKLFRSLSYVDKYIDLHQIFKVYDTEGVLTVDNLAKFVDANKKYLSRTETRLKSLTDVLIETIENAIAKRDAQPKPGVPVGLNVHM